jgi:hypothetical protein
VPQDLAFDLRGVIKNELLKPEPEGNPDADPMDPMGNTPEAKAITRRYRLRLVPGHAVIPSMEVKTRPLYGMPMTLHPRT